MVLTSTHNLCFGAKIRKIGIPYIPQFCYIKLGFKGVYISQACFPDGRKEKEKCSQNTCQIKPCNKSQFDFCFIEGHVVRYGWRSVKVPVINLLSKSSPRRNSPRVVNMLSYVIVF